MRLTAVFVFLVGVLTLAFAQPVVISGNTGFTADSPYNRLYNTRTVLTVKGKVTGKQVAPPMKGMANAVTLMVKAANAKTYQIDVGPEWYVNNQLTQIKVGDTISVTGSRVSIDGHDVILAEQIVKGKNVLALRRPMGRPYWDAMWTDTTTGQTGNPVLVGQIVGLDSFNDNTGGTVQMMTVHTDQGDFQVALAPLWYMQRQAAQLEIGQTVDVSSWAPLGTPQSPAGYGLSRTPIIFASSVAYGPMRIFIRGPGGSPLWYGADGTLHAGG
jgi:hypothetical protein